MYLPLRELVEEILGDPPGVGASIADEGLAQLSGQAEGAEHVAGDLFIVPLESVDRLELVGDEVGEAADVLDQGEDRGPDGLQPDEQLAVGLARIVLPAEPQPDGTLLMLVELVRIGRRDDLEILVRVEPEVLEPLPESSAEKVGVTIGGRTQDNEIVFLPVHRGSLCMDRVVGPAKANTLLLPLYRLLR